MKDFLSYIKKITSNPLILPLSIIFVAGVLAIVQILFAVLVSSFQLRPQPFVLPLLTDYPVWQSPKNITLSAQAAVVMDDDSKTVIFGKNTDLKFSPASTTKLMTALIGLQTYKLDQLLEIKRSNVEGTIVGFLPGQKVTFLDLLYGMFLPSGNDAALAVADNFPGGESAFVKKMNDMAHRFHLNNTHFGDPAGLTDDDTYTTVVDLAHLASIIMKEPIIRQIVKTKTFVITVSDGTQYPVENLNKLLGQYGIDGVKTGHTSEAKDVLITSTIKDDHRIFTVVMRSDDRFADTIALMQGVVKTIAFETIGRQ